MGRYRAVALGLVLLATAGIADVDGMWPYRPWADGEVHGQWTSVFHGYGRVTGTDREVVLEPATAASAETTHGALVRTTASHHDPDFGITVRTEKQLRAGTPNPWEVGWVLWNYRDNDHFYAVALKPNGWEVSKQDPAYPGNQRFIATGEDRTFPIGRQYRVEVSHGGSGTTVAVDGRDLVTFTDADSPYRSGSIGLYTEDARVRFQDLVVLGTTAG